MIYLLNLFFKKQQQINLKFCRILINIFLCLTQFGFCCVYFVFVSQNLQLVVDHHFGPRDYHFYMAIVLPAVLVLCSVKARFRSIGFGP